MNVAYEWHEVPSADFAVIGDPVAHSRSPQMHQAAYDALRLKYLYVAIRVSAGKLATALDHLCSLGFRGVNITVPHKAEAMAWVAKPDQLSQRIGVVNTINLSDGSATNTDAPGFLDTLEQFGFPQGSSALILGAGGSARSIAAVLPATGFQVSIWNRTPYRAEDLAEEFDLKAIDSPLPNFDLIVNTTSVGLSKERLPIDWTQARPNAVAYDLVYGSTPFLQEAETAGLRTLDGKELLVAQGARSFEFWLGISPPRNVMLEAIQ